MALDYVEKPVSGADRVLSGDCPMLAIHPIECIFCSYGHIAECHYPFTCDEINCGYSTEMRYVDEEIN